MPTKRKAAAKKQTDTTGVTGARLIDGAPYFADHDGTPMNRRQWLAATKDQRKQAALDELSAAASATTATADFF